MAENFPNLWKILIYRSKQLNKPQVRKTQRLYFQTHHSQIVERKTERENVESKGKCNDMNRNNKIMDEFSETLKLLNPETLE